ncbi:hypothetical protein GOV13_03975 [Candidatus Pacearchaeota archaeon]|nr:hypothetical protein [Candidatus Pacearchaeota archaeon]
MAPWIIFDESDYVERVVYEEPVEKDLRRNENVLGVMKISGQQAGEIEEALSLNQAVPKYLVERYSKLENI